MNLDDQMEIYKKRTDIMPDEDRIRQTVQASMESFLQSESEKILSYHSFLRIQFGLIRKRWWALQMGVLALVWAALMPAQDNPYIYRSLGLAATLFVILVIPELWKNRINDCIEIEGSTYYTLRQIYSARILLFGLADILLITLFCCMAAVSLQISLTELLIQFIFPMTVTACICFGIFGSRNQVNESAALGLCILWSALWWCVLMDEKLYRAISVPVWMILLGMALLFLIITICRSIRQCDGIWEVNADGTENE